MGMCIQWDTKQWLKGSNYRDLPRGPVVRDLPCNTGDLSLSPGQGTEIPHAAGQPVFHAATTEPSCHN